ncbi:hypothetical protein EFP84_07180 [Leptospira kmetyi]|uniref:Uncharacterized protein n=1 Tax=Leptospira kmetyi TaxID=408139 RepID=A0A5F1XS90_9LEPT|nr:hypothetical protein EFP84_07180 [Leptospira kmetyi]TGK16889.1 hypothetical protein EHO62_14380 [Leptospira kmetyi]TGK33020.1 hypothetical protein EHO66_04625 [Leptospira kmetyi]TGL70515.1 hypothetical protein EHQ67_06960 [Leptospira kmetyi]
MIISWEKIRHQHPKEEWKRLLKEVDCSGKEGRRSSRIFLDGNGGRKMQFNAGAFLIEKFDFPADLFCKGFHKG